jgi:hypothetical protein
MLKGCLTCFAAVVFACRLFSQAEVRACECPPAELSAKETDRYTIIFKGMVSEVKECGDRPGEATFEVDELYKGEIPARFVIQFDCDGPCAKGFSAGDEWIIYTRYLQVSVARMDWCSHSRKYFRNEKEDYYAVNFGVGYFEEADFLRKSLGLHRTLSDRPTVDAGRNLRPDTGQSVIILLTSIAAIVLFYWLFRRLFK